MAPPIERLPWTNWCGRPPHPIYQEGDGVCVNCGAIEPAKPTGATHTDSIPVGSSPITASSSVQSHWQPPRSQSQPNLLQNPNVTSNKMRTEINARIQAARSQSQSAASPALSSQSSTGSRATHPGVAEKGWTVLVHGRKHYYNSWEDVASRLIAQEIKLRPSFFAIFFCIEAKYRIASAYIKNLRNK